jgi:hypothetical protein
VLIRKIIELCISAFRELEAVSKTLLLGAIFKFIVSDLLLNLSRQALLVILTTEILKVVILFRIKFFEDVRKVLETLRLLVDRIMVIFLLGCRDVNPHEIENTVIEVGDNRFTFFLDILSYSLRFNTFCSID